MNTILEQLQELADADLYALSEAVDMELQRRDEIVGEISDSARLPGRRAGGELSPPQRVRGPPVRIVGIGKAPRDVPLDSVLSEGPNLERFMASP